MKIEIYYRDDETLEAKDYKNSIIINITTEIAEISLHFEDGEIEDNNISRNFNDIIAIKDALLIAYNAGKMNEPFEIIEEDRCI